MFVKNATLAAAAAAMIAGPLAAQPRPAAPTVDKTAQSMITVTGHAEAARRHAEAGTAEARKAEKAGHKGPVAAAAHKAASGHFRAAAQEHEAAARKAE
jgi:hypothetical protein